MKKKYYDGFIVHDILDAHLKPEKMLEVLKAFAEVKGVDAVEVIRCKDCKHRPYKDERGNVIPVEEECSPCPCVDDGDWYYNYIPKDDWYCANGEPKDNEK